MPNSFVQVAPDSTGKRVDTLEGTVSGQTVQRQRISIGGGSDSDIANNVAVTADQGLTVDGTHLQNISRLLMAILGQMPRLSLNSKAVTDLSETSLATVTTVNTVSASSANSISGYGSSNRFFADAIPHMQSQAVALQIYDRFIIT